MEVPNGAEDVLGGECTAFWCGDGDDVDAGGWVDGCVRVGGVAVGGADTGLGVDGRSARSTA